MKLKLALAATAIFVSTYLSATIVEGQIKGLYFASNGQVQIHVMPTGGATLVRGEIDPSVSADTKKAMIAMAMTAYVSDLDVKFWQTGFRWTAVKIVK